MDLWQLRQLVRAVRKRRGLRQEDLARLAEVSASTISRFETGRCGALSIDAVDRIAGALDIRAELRGKWHGSEGERLLNWRHSMLADRFAAFLSASPGWIAEPEVSFSIYGERGVIDQLGWNGAHRHLLVVELKTEFVDLNEMLGTLDRKVRLARRIAAERGWDASMVSCWLIVADSHRNRRHAAEHRALLEARFRLDGRSLSSFLRSPNSPTTGIAFWPNVHVVQAKAGSGDRNAVAGRKPAPTTGPEPAGKAGSWLRASPPADSPR